MYLHSTETVINSLALAEYGPPSPYHRGYDSRRTEFLHQCLDSAKSTVDAYLSFSPTELTGISILPMLQFRHSTQLLYRLSLLEDPSWDRSFVGESIDIVRCLSQAADRFEMASDVAKSAGNRSGQKFLSKVASGLRNLTPAWSAALGQPGAAGPEAGSIHTESMVLGFADDTWLQDAFWSWDSGNGSI